MKYSDMTRKMKAVVNKLGGMKGVKKFLCGELVVRPALLQQIANVSVSGVERFVVPKYVPEVDTSMVQFKQLFRVFGGLVESMVEETNIAIHRLKMDSLNVLILNELGDRAHISFVHLFELLKRQSKGESGPLLTNGNGNIAYIVGRDKRVRAVNAAWERFRDYSWWSFNTNLVEDVLLSTSPKGYQVLSR